MKLNRGLWFDQDHITMPYDRLYYDGPLEGLIEYKGEPLYFTFAHQRMRPTPKCLYIAYRLPADLMAKLQRERHEVGFDAGEIIPVVNRQGKRSFEVAGFFHG